MSRLQLNFKRECTEEITDIVAIMKLRESSDNLIRDYQETAKEEVKKLDEELAPYGDNYNSDRIKD